MFRLSLPSTVVQIFLDSNAVFSKITLLGAAIPGGLLLEVDSHFRYYIFTVQHPNFRRKVSDIFSSAHIWRNFAIYPHIQGWRLRELLLFADVF